MSVRTTYSESRAHLGTLWDRVTDDRETVIISRRGKPDAALIAADELASLEETAHLLRSPANARRLLTALNRALQGTGSASTSAQLRRELGLEREG